MAMGPDKAVKREGAIKALASGTPRKSRGRDFYEGKGTEVTMSRHRTRADTSACLLLDGPPPAPSPHEDSQEAAEAGHVIERQPDEINKPLACFPPPKS